MKFVVTPYPIDGKTELIAMFRCETCDKLLGFALAKSKDDDIYDCPCGKAVNVTPNSGKEIHEQAAALTGVLEEWKEFKASFASAPVLLQKRVKAAKNSA